MGNQQNNACSACAGEDVVLENVSRELALMRFLQLQQCGDQPLMCEVLPNRYTVCRGHLGCHVSPSPVAVLPRFACA
ncbi:hypothetical protein VX159_02640 [Dechloromonas sp. ZY10]|uniref:hypothetical protein n=1 Tax=Dechloromonas aquae TaxID=2664436 RepID=UPI0035288930